MIYYTVTKVETVRLNNRNRLMITFYLNYRAKPNSVLCISAAFKKAFFEDKEKQTEYLGSSTGIHNEKNTFDDPSNGHSIMTEKHAALLFHDVYFTEFKVVSD